MVYTSVLEQQVYDFIVVFARTSAIIAFAPMFGARSVPNYLKGWIAFSMAIVFTAILTPLDYPKPESGVALFFMLAGEAMIGAVIGFAASIIFEVIIFAGYIMDYMIGFGFINIVDPQSGASISLMAFFYSFFSLLLFIMSDTHYILIEAMVRSYELIPIFNGGVNEFSLRHITQMVAAIFYTGFQIAGPIFIVMFMIDFSLGLIAKTVPQLQILVVGFPIKIGVGLVAMGLALPAMANYIISLFDYYRDTLMWLFKYLGAGP